MTDMNAVLTAAALRGEVITLHTTRSRRNGQVTADVFGLTGNGEDAFAALSSLAEQIQAREVIKASPSAPHIDPAPTTVTEPAEITKPAK